MRKNGSENSDTSRYHGRNFFDLQNFLDYYRCTLSRFITDFALVAENVFLELVHELASRYCSASLYVSTGQTF